MSVEELESGPPAQVAISDLPFGSQVLQRNEDGYVPAKASVTFGFAKDEITAVSVVSGAGEIPALLASNAFLAIVEDPLLGSRVHTIVARDAAGRPLTIPIEVAPFGDEGPSHGSPGGAPGPREIERTVRNGTIGWITRREHRGEPFPLIESFDPSRVPMKAATIFARVIRPDSSSQVRIALIVGDAYRTGTSDSEGEQICSVVFEPLGPETLGCSPLGSLFASRPVSYGLSMGSGGDQFVTLAGLASDEVAALEIYLVAGERRVLPLLDSAFASKVARRDFPIRLVARDDARRVIFTEEILG
ncbi:MAG: hypothetical protein IT201_13395 [Thermoleophilia bacterium]|nr:hypothetical protein [Thermoleophilia bacterium]